MLNPFTTKPFSNQEGEVNHIDSALSVLKLWWPGAAWRAVRLHRLVPIALQNQEVRALDTTIAVEICTCIVVGVWMTLIPGVFESQEV